MFRGILDRLPPPSDLHWHFIFHGWCSLTLKIMPSLLLSKFSGMMTFTVTSRFTGIYSDVSWSILSNKEVKIFWNVTTEHPNLVLWWSIRTERYNWILFFLPKMTDFPNLLPCCSAVGSSATPTKLLCRISMGLSNPSSSLESAAVKYSSREELRVIDFPRAAHCASVFCSAGVIFVCVCHNWDFECYLPPLNTPLKLTHFQFLGPSLTIQDNNDSPLH